MKTIRTLAVYLLILVACVCGAMLGAEIDKDTRYWILWILGWAGGLLVSFVLIKKLTNK